MIKYISDSWQIFVSLHVLPYPPPITETTMIYIVAEIMVFRTHNPVMRHNPEFQMYVSYKSDVKTHNPVMCYTYESDVTPNIQLSF